MVVGNANYQHWGALPQAITDAENVARALNTHQDFDVEVFFDVGGDTLKIEARKFLEKRGKDPDARLLFWFAGHGASVPSFSDEVGLIIPVDAPAPSDSVAVELKSLSVEYIRNWITHSVAARHVMVVLDSCFSGALFKTKRERSGTPARSSSQPSPLASWSNPVRHFITAGTASQKVNDDGIFANTFVDAISGRGQVPIGNAPFLTGHDLGEHLVHRFLEDKRSHAPVHMKLPIAGRTDHLGEFTFKLPPNSVRARAGIDLSGGMGTLPGSGLDTLATECLYGKPHREAGSVALEVAALADPRTNTVRHAFDPLQAEIVSGGTTLSEPHTVQAVTASGGRIAISYAENGRMLLIPTHNDTMSSPDDHGTYLLRGAWRRGGGMGCVEFTLNVRTRFGKGKIYYGKRAKWRENLPVLGTGKKPLLSTLTIIPDK